MRIFKLIQFSDSVYNERTWKLAVDPEITPDTESDELVIATNSALTYKGEDYAIRRRYASRNTTPEAQEQTQMIITNAVPSKWIEVEGNKWLVIKK